MNVAFAFQLDRDVEKESRIPTPQEVAALWKKAVDVISHPNSTFDDSAFRS